LELKNSTDFPDWFIRRMISWICKNDWINWSTKKIRGGITVRNKTRGQLSGHAWPLEERIVVSIGVPDVFRPVLTDEDGKTVWGENARPKRTGEVDTKQRIQCLVSVMAHEIKHLAQYEKSRGRYPGKYSEREADIVEKMVLAEFKELEDVLVPEWMKAPAYANKPKKEKPTRKQVNAQRAHKNLKNWERKLKLAETKVKKYQQQVQRYQKDGVI